MDGAFSALMQRWKATGLGGHVRFEWYPSRAGTTQLEHEWECHSCVSSGFGTSGATALRMMVKIAEQQIGIPSPD